MRTLLADQNPDHQRAEMIIARSRENYGQVTHEGEKADEGEHPSAATEGRQRARTENQGQSRGKEAAETEEAPRDTVTAEEEEAFKDFDPDKVFE